MKNWARPLVHGKLDDDILLRTNQHTPVLSDLAGVAPTHILLLQT